MLKTINNPVSVVNELSWLDATYELPLQCRKDIAKIDFSDVFLCQIEEITYEDKFPRLEALENVFASLRIDGINIIYLILGEKERVSFYFGIAKDAQNPQHGNLREIATRILVPSLQGNFRGSKVRLIDPEEKNDILEKLAPPKKANEADSKEVEPMQFICMEGVPGTSTDKEKSDFQGVDRLVDIMLGDSYGLLIIAKPVNSKIEIQKLEDNLADVYQHITLYSKQQVQQGTNTSTNQSESHTLGSNESSTEGINYAENKGESFGISYQEGEQSDEGKSSGDSSSSTTKGKGTSSSKTHSVTTNKGSSRTDSNQISIGSSEQYSKQSGSQQGSNINFSMDKVNKKMQEWIKHFDEIIYPRLDCAKGKGFFVVSTLLFAQDNPVLEKLTGVMRSIFTGETGNRTPLTPLKLQEGDCRLKALLSFQQPLLELRKTQQADFFRAAIAKSKCIHFNREDPLDFYAGNWMSSVELSRMAGIPQKEVVGLRLREEVEFGLNINKPECSDNQLELGNLVQAGNESEIPVMLDMKNLDRHIFVAGVTGSGKTTTCQLILIEAKRKFLVIEPAKTEYRILRQQFPDLLIFTLGKDTLAPFRLNPLEFMPDESISSRVDMLMASIVAAFDMEAAIPQIIEQAIYASYEKYGWNTKTDKNKLYPGDEAFKPGVYAFPTLSDVVDNLEEVVKKQGFDQRLHADYLGSCKARLGGLLVGAKGRMLNCRRSIDFMQLLEENVVLELEEIRNGSEKSLIIGFVLTNLLVAIKSKFKATGGKKVQHITLVEEAHRLLTKFQPGDNPNKRLAVDTFADMLAEIRKYGESMIIADQIPDKLTPEVLKNTNIKIVHRIFAQDDKDVIGSTMSLSEEQRNFLSNLELGRAIVFSGDWPKAVHVKVRLATDTSAEEAIDENVLRLQVLKFYAEHYKSGIFPGLEKLMEKPDIKTVEDYIEHLQDLPEFPKSDVFQNKKLREGFRNNSQIKEKKAELKKLFRHNNGLSMLALVFALQYSSPEKLERGVKVFEEYFNESND